MIGPHDSLGSMASLRGTRDRLINNFAAGFPYSRKLQGHKSCINAITFSSGDGRWLASGGDDLTVQLYDFHQQDVTKPSCFFLGHRANIMTLGFSASNRYIISGGADHTILKYDMSSVPFSPDRPQHQTEQYRQHSDTVRGISTHAFRDEIFLSASEDGRLLLHDSRDENRMTRAQCTIQNDCEFTDVQCHPIDEHLFATSDHRGHVCLRDARMAFGPPSTRTLKGIVRTYNTKLSKNGINHLSSPEASSITFDREGNKLGVTILKYLPTIYSVSDPQPIAICSGRFLPDGSPIAPNKRTYYNSCTMKRGCFGGPDLGSDEFWSSGSDDFRGYVWRLPDVEYLVEARKEISADSWMSEPFNKIAVCDGLLGNRYEPVELSTPAFHLNGHKSIVNNTLIHPNYLHIVTSGIERHIILHGVSSSSPCTSDLVPTEPIVRDLPDATPEAFENYLRAMTGTYPLVDDNNEQSGEELDTILLFDQILRQEGESDIFDVPRYDTDSSEDMDDDSSDEHSDT